MAAPPPPLGQQHTHASQIPEGYLLTVACGDVCIPHVLLLHDQGTLHLSISILPSSGVFLGRSGSYLLCTGSAPTNLYLPACVVVIVVTIFAIRIQRPSLIIKHSPTAHEKRGKPTKKENLRTSSTLFIDLLL